MANAILIQDKIEGEHYTETYLMKVSTDSSFEFEVPHTLPRHPNYVCATPLNEADTDVLNALVYPVVDEVGGATVIYKVAGDPTAGTGKVYVYVARSPNGTVTSHFALKLIWTHSISR